MLRLWLALSIGYAVFPTAQGGCHFTRVRGYNLLGYNDQTLISITFKHCLTECLTATDFTCLSVDWNENSKTCYLSSENRATKPTAFKSYNPEDYLEPICDEGGKAKAVFYEGRSHSSPGNVQSTDILQSASTMQRTHCAALCNVNPEQCFSFLVQELENEGPFRFKCTVYSRTFSQFQQTSSGRFYEERFSVVDEDP